MSRVSDAMRRAGHSDDEQSGTRLDDTAFVSGEEGVEDTGSYEPPPSSITPEIGPAPCAMELVPHSAAAIPAAIPIDATRSDAGNDVRIHDVLRILNRRRWLIIGVVATFLAIAATYNHMVTPIYQAQARVLIQPTAPQVAAFRSSTEDPGRVDYLVTQLEVLRSRALASKALAHLNLLSTDPARAAGQISGFIGSLSVSQTKSERGDSRVVNVAFRSVDPQHAAQMANGLAKVYVADNLEKMRQGSREAAEWFNERLPELRRELSGAEGALQQYREKQDAVSLDQGQNIVIQKFTQLSAAAITARAERLGKEAQYQELEAIRDRGAALDTFPLIQSSSAIQSIKAELATLEQQKVKLSEQFLPGHPEMVEVDNQIATKKSQRDAEISKMVLSVRQDYINSRSTEQGLLDALKKQEQEVNELNKKSIQYGALQREAASSQQIVETMLQKLKETELTGSLQSNNISILDNAEVPGSAIWPRKEVNLAIGFIAGSMLALGLVFGLEYLHPRLAEPEDIAASLGLPLLGVAPQISELDDRGATLNALPMPFQEAIRGIRTQIFLSAASSGVRTLAVTSSRPGEGKTVVSSSLAISMAMAGRRVLLIDGDLRRAQLRHVFNIPRSPGLSNVIAGEIKPSQALVETSVKGLFVLPAGTEMANPGDLLDSDRLDQLIQGLRHVFDVVVIDCPPVMAVADAAIVANAATSVVFVVGSGTTSPDEARLAVDRLASVQARIVGVVLNKAKVDSRSQYYYSYHAAEDTA